MESGVDTGLMVQNCEVERVVLKRKVISKTLDDNGQVRMVTVGVPTITTSPVKFVKLGSEFVEKMLYADRDAMGVFFVVCLELSSGKFTDSVYLHHHEALSKSGFRRGLFALKELGLLTDTENPHIYRVNRSFVEYGKNKRPNVS